MCSPDLSTNLEPRNFVTQAPEAGEEDELFAVGPGAPAPQAAPQAADRAVTDWARSPAPPTPAAGPASSLLSDHEQAEALIDVPTTANGTAGEQDLEGPLGHAFFYLCNYGRGECPIMDRIFFSSIACNCIMNMFDAPFLSDWVLIAGVSSSDVKPTLLECISFKSSQGQSQRSKPYKVRHLIDVLMQRFPL